MCSQQKYFFDLDHLNSSGADEFSKLLAKDLKNIIN
jgi:lysophospholipase L1-like esterase